MVSSKIGDPGLQLGFDSAPRRRARGPLTPEIGAGHHLRPVVPIADSLCSSPTDPASLPRIHPTSHQPYRYFSSTRIEMQPAPCPTFRVRLAGGCPPVEDGRDLAALS